MYIYIYISDIMRWFHSNFSFYEEHRGVSAEVGSVCEGDSIRCIMADVPLWVKIGGPEILAMENGNF